MARNSGKADDESIRINFRLNPRRPKERVILEFLRQHAENYDASRIIKQALYEMATGRSWVNGQAAQRVSDEEDVPPPIDDHANKVMDDILSGLDDWGSS